MCRALSRLAAAAGITLQRWLNTCCQTWITSRSLCPSRLDTSHTALNTCNIDNTLKKPPRWGLLNPFSDPQDTGIQQQSDCLRANNPRNQALHRGLPPCVSTIPHTHACLSVRGRFCSCEVHPHSTVVCLLSQLLASSASFRRAKQDGVFTALSKQTSKNRFVFRLRTN